MATMTRKGKWTLLFRLPGGHKYFSGPDGKIGLADDSGQHPEATERFYQVGAVLCLDTSKPIRFGWTAIVPVMEGTQDAGHVIESAEGGLMLAARLGLAINAGGHNYRLALIED